jgi:hypothetical protein
MEQLDESLVLLSTYGLTDWLELLSQNHNWELIFTSMGPVLLCKLYECLRINVSSCSLYYTQQDLIPVKWWHLFVGYKIKEPETYIFTSKLITDNTLYLNGVLPTEISTDLKIRKAITSLYEYHLFFGKAIRLEREID